MRSTRLLPAKKLMVKPTIVQMTPMRMSFMTEIFFRICGKMNISGRIMNWVAARTPMSPTLPTISVK